MILRLTSALLLGLLWIALWYLAGVAAWYFKMRRHYGTMGTNCLCSHSGDRMGDIPRT